MFDVLADHRNNLLIQMCRVELQVGLSISFTSDFFVIGLLHLLLYFLYCHHLKSIYIYIRGGTVHRCHGSVCTSVRGSRFDTISVQQEKKEIYYARFLFIYFEQTVVQIKKKNPPRCENTKYYYIVIYIQSVLFSL